MTAEQAMQKALEIMYYEGRSLAAGSETERILQRYIAAALLEVYADGLEAADVATSAANVVPGSSEWSEHVGQLRVEAARLRDGK